jgi:hypothetical protein
MTDKKKSVIIPGGMMVGKTSALKQLLEARMKQLARPLPKLEEDVVELDEDQKEMFESANKAVSAILINTMLALKIPNYIEIDAEANDEVFHIKIIRLGPEDSGKNANNAGASKKSNE